MRFGNIAGFNASAAEPTLAEGIKTFRIDRPVTHTSNGIKARRPVVIAIYF